MHIAAAEMDTDLSQGRQKPCEFNLPQQYLLLCHGVFWKGMCLQLTQTPVVFLEGSSTTAKGQSGPSEMTLECSWWWCVVSQGLQRCRYQGQLSMVIDGIKCDSL